MSAPKIPKIFINKKIKLSEAIQDSLHADSNKILLNFKQISVIDAVSPKYRKCTQLFLSQNRLKNLHGIGQFTNLQCLSLAYNDVCYYDFVVDCSRLMILLN